MLSFFHNNLHKEDSGFTIIELLIVVAIMLILASGIGLLVTAGIPGARNSRLVSDISAIRSGVAAWYATVAAPDFTDVSSAALVAEHVTSGLCDEDTFNAQDWMVDEGECDLAPAGPYDNTYRVIGGDCLEGSSTGSCPYSDVPSPPSDLELPDDTRNLYALVVTNVDADQYESVLNAIRARLWSHSYNSDEEELWLVF